MSSSGQLLFVVARKPQTDDDRDVIYQALFMPYSTEKNELLTGTFYRADCRLRLLIGFCYIRKYFSNLVGFSFRFKNFSLVTGKAIARQNTGKIEGYMGIV